jgi:nicotinamidase-related amidase
MTPALCSGENPRSQRAAARSEPTRKAKAITRMTWNPADLDAEWPFDIFASDFKLEPASTALLVIDMQNGQLAVDPSSALAQRYPRIADYWQQRVEQTVIPNTLRLIECCRRRGMGLVFTRNGNVTSTGHEMSRRLKAKLAGQAPETHRQSSDYQIDARLAPTAADLIVDKLTSGAFTASFLDHALRNMGVQSIITTGVLTDGCVFGTARSAAELGYQTLICEDACATFTQRAHEDALLMHARIFGRIDTTEAVIAELSA